MKSAITDKNSLPNNVQNQINKKKGPRARTANVNRNNTNQNNNGGMQKQGAVPRGGYNGYGGGMASGSSANIKQSSPEFYHPLFQNLNMMLPRDRRERNEWCRHFYRVEPIIATALDLHTEFPISDFDNVASDPYIKKFFDHMAFDKLNMVNLLLDIGLEYWKIGDVFPFGQINESEGMWEKFVLLNPDYIDIQSSVLAEDPVMELIPDAEIQSIVNSGPNGKYGDIYDQLPDDVIRQVKMGKNIKLDSRLVSQISHKAAQYETWGTPVMMRCFKTLIYKDKLRQAQDAIANRHITPLRVAKIGQPGEPMPSQDDLDAFRDTLMQADQDPNFFLVYHYGLQFEYVGSNGKILPLNQEFDFIQKELMNGLGINQAMLNGEGPTYSNAQVGYDTLARRYMAYRLRLESWIKNKVYKPIAEIQGFYESKNGEISASNMTPKQRKISAQRGDMELVIPDITWREQDLTTNQSAMNFIQQLQQKGLISMQTVLPMLNLDPETEKKQLEEERGTVFDPDAPKTGPLPNQGSGSGNPKPGDKKPSTPDKSDSGGDSGGDSDTTKETSIQDFFSKTGRIKTSSYNKKNNKEKQSVEATINWRNTMEQIGLNSQFKKYLISINQEVEDYYNELLNNIEVDMEEDLDEFSENVTAVLDYYTEPIVKIGKEKIANTINEDIVEEEEFINHYKNNDLNDFEKTLKDALNNCFGELNNKKLFEEISEIIFGFCLKLFRYSQLLECLNHNIKTVSLSSNYNSCPICRTKSKFNHNVGDLIDNIDEFHESCKLVIKPNIKESVEELSIKNTNIKFINIPKSIKNEIEPLINKIKMSTPELLSDKTIKFVNNISDLDEFNTLLNNNHPKDRVNQIINDVQGSVVSFEYNNEIFISNEHLENIKNIILKSILKDKLMLNNDLGFWRKEYNNKKKSKYIGNGVSIYAKPFINYLAEEDFKTYFIESAIYYILNPQLLKSIDKNNYKQLKENVFNNIEFRV
jgi:hypothetical protein